MSSGSDRRAARLAWIAGAAALLAHGWSLTLGFQLDDHTLLERPLGLFALGHQSGGVGVEPFALRFVPWLAFALLDFLPGPPSALAHRLCGLLLHGLTAALLVRAMVHARVGTAGALAAGLLFGVGAGGAQAFTWSAGWGDLFAALFAVAASERFLLARTKGPRRSRQLVVQGGVALLLALLSKESLLPLAPALALALWAAPMPAGSPRSRRPEWVALTAALAIALCIRWLYLGSLLPKYGRREVAVADLIDGPLSAARLLGQALVPVVRDPLVLDLGQGPYWAFLRATGGPLLGVGLLGCTALLLLSLRPRAGFAALLLCGAAMLVAAPAGLLAGEVVHNGLGRTQYAPLAFAAAALGLAVHGFSQCGGLGRALSIGWAAWIAAIALPCNLHVSAVERLAGRERLAWVRAAHVAARAADGAAAQLVVLVPPGHFAGVSQLGDLVDRALTEPFGPLAPLSVRMAFDGREGARELLAPLDPGTRRSWLGTRTDREPAALGAEARAARMPEWVELPPSQPAPTDPLEFVQQEVRFGAPLALAGWAGALVEFDAAPSGEATVQWLLGTAALTHGRVVFPSAGSGAIRLELAPPLLAPERLLSGVDGLLWQSPEGSPARLWLRYGSPPREWTAPLPLVLLGADGEPAPPPRVHWRGGAAGAVDPAWVRAEVRLGPGEGSVRLFLDGPIDPGGDGDGLWSAPLTHVHAEPEGDPSQVAAVPWAVWVSQVAVPQLEARGLASGELSWSFELLHRGGLPADRSPRFRAEFRLRP